ncbi:MAG: hypothetical protein GWP11_05615 [Proteobacteria bacterium]|nr:hypothetical protein [Pseudomonadota bacterium]
MYFFKILKTNFKNKKAGRYAGVSLRGAEHEIGKKVGKRRGALFAAPAEKLFFIPLLPGMSNIFLQQFSRKLKLPPPA